MEIDDKIASLARECNDLNEEFAEVSYRRVMNVLFTLSGDAVVIDENVLDEYKALETELSHKIDDLNEAIEERDGS